MIGNQASQPQQVIMLDLSLFILDLLDPRKIQERAEIRDHILEVPSALVQMLRDSRVGSPILFLFIHSLLVKSINKYKKEQITDQRIARLVNSPDFVIRQEAMGISQRLFDEFSDLIETESKVATPDSSAIPEIQAKNKASDYPIRRYDAIGSFSREDQKLLQGIYTRELNLPEHPLYDQYFSQIYNAQINGSSEQPTFRRRTVSLGDETFEVISSWKGKKRLDEESNAVQASREFLEWFITTYIKNEWKDIAFDASLELSVAGVLEGTLAGAFGVSLVTLAGGTMIKAIAEAPPEIIQPNWKPFLIAGVITLMFVCLFILVKPTWYLKKLLLPTPTNIPLTTPTLTLIFQTSTPTLRSLPTLITAPTITPTQLISYSETLLATNSSPNFCMYVVQSNDTIQSIASWFNITEGDLLHSDNLVNQGRFGFHQLIKVNAPCCTNFGLNNGYSYSVQLNDNVYRLAIDKHTSVEKIVTANNLDNSRYIQYGQMLCIPNP